MTTSNFSTPPPASMPANAEPVHTDLSTRPYYASAADEISLVDVALVVMKRKRVLWLTVALILGFGVIYVLMSPDKYKYAVVLETGSYVLPDEHGNLGERKLIEPAGHTKSKLETSMIPQTLLRYAEQENDDQLPDFTVTVPDGSNLVEMSVKAPESKGPVVLQLLNNIANQVAQDHKEKSSDVVEALRQQVESMGVNIQELSATLVAEQRNREATAKSLARLDDKRALLTSQVERVTKEVAQLQQSRDRYFKNAVQAKDALAVLLIDNEISQSARQRDALENELHIELASEQAWLQKRFENQSVKVETVNAELGRAKEIFGRFSDTNPNINSNTQSDATEGSTETYLELGKNIYPTTMSVDPYRAREPLGISKVVQLVIVVMLSLFFGLMMTFVAEFISQVRQADQDES